MPAMPSLHVEFHCHTTFSIDSLTKPGDLVRAARKKGLERIIITDHNTIAGAQAARALDPALVIVGEEIMTTRGELLAAFVTEEIPAGLSPQESIRRLRDQGAFISVAHPFDVLRKGHWQMNDLLEILPLVDAIETFNARCWRAAYNTRAQIFAREHGIPGTVGSDAHTTRELGRATLTLPWFESGRALAEVIGQGIAHTRLSSPFIHTASHYASTMKRLGIFS